LYELLTGHRPYVAASRFHEFAQAILEDEPLRPSAAVALAQERLPNDQRPAVTPEWVSARRSTDLKRLQRSLRGDLDTIVLKALRKEPERRYPTASALADDVRRHRAGLPIAARPDTLRYRTSTFVRRHRLGVAAAAMILLSLVGG